jgi:hypothetical protein
LGNSPGYELDLPQDDRNLTRNERIDVFEQYLCRIRPFVTQTCLILSQVQFTPVRSSEIEQLHYKSAHELWSYVDDIAGELYHPDYDLDIVYSTITNDFSSLEIVCNALQERALHASSKENQQAGACGTGCNVCTFNPDETPDLSANQSRDRAA